MTDKNIVKYLNHYAEEEIALVANFPKTKCYQHVVIIPAYKEDITFVERFSLSSLAKRNVLMIVVINQPDYEQSTHCQAKLSAEIKLLGNVCWQHESLSLVQLSNANADILTIDRFSKPIPAKEGVGLARKIAADIALSLIQQHIILSSWIYSTDADVTLPDNYFQPLSLTNETVATCFNFEHSCADEKINSANQQYETALRYFYLGLTFAGSRYAYYSIGSILTFSALTYACVRGFPKRSAGEDFYLLNKMAKLGAIAYIPNVKLQIKARTSDRVPFGTGPAVSQILALEENNEPYCYYHPQVFELLKCCLTAFNELWQSRADIQAWYTDLPIEVSHALQQIGFSSFIDKNISSKQAQFDKQLLVWFDAFKTLKFIHAIRDFNFPNIPLTDALQKTSYFKIN